MINVQLRFSDSPSRFENRKLSTVIEHDALLAELIRQIDDKLIKQADVAAALGIAPARVSEMRKGDRRIQAREMAPLARILGVDSAAPPTAPQPKKVQSSTEIPVLGKVATGVWLEQSVDDPANRQFITYDRLPGDKGASDLFAVIPEGASMNLTFPPGMVLICRRVPFGFAEVTAGDLVIVEREAHDLREMTCKRLAIDEENGDFLLVSESDRPEYQTPIRVKRSAENEDVDTGVTIIGKVERGVMDFARRP